MIKRWILYLKESASPLMMISFAFSLSFGIHATLDILYHNKLFSYWHESIIAAVNVMLLFIFSRISDEFKDYEVDKVYFPNRPLPSGRVSFKDLAILKWICVFLIFGLNILWHTAIPAFLVMFLFFFLMSKWFFIPKILANNRILILLTHAPVYIFMMMFIIALYTNPLNITLISKEHILISVWFVLPGVIWEIARKIRSPEEDKDGYQSYSQMLGFRKATFILIIFFVIHFLLFLYVSNSWSISRITLLIFGISVLSFIGFCLRLIVKIPVKNNLMKLFGSLYYIGSYILILINTLFIR
jgi:hypothetical protein